MVQLKVASLFFFSGLAVVIALVIVVYVVAWIYDRASGSAEALLTPTELEERRVASTLVKEAGLAGLLPDEKNRVMRHFFQESSKACVKQYSNGDIEAPDFRSESEKAVGDEKSGARDEKRNSSASGINKKAETSMNTNSKSKHDSNTDHKLTNKSQCTKNTGPNCTNAKKDDKIKSKQKHGCSCCEDSNDLDQASKITQSIVNMDRNSRELDDNGNPKGHGEGKEKESSGHDAENEAEEGVCPICLVEFANDENIIIGSSCGHVFHFECFMQWVEKNHTDCPLCRSDMLTPANFLASAYEVLGEQRVNKLKHINEEAGRRLEAWAANHRGGRIQESPGDESSSSEPADPLGQKGSLRQNGPTSNSGYFQTHGCDG
eukprot:CAMPEP_0113645908 /NCGR_PEP_ID=MMETSP0017_2-20120614/24218_1 /TAXON_ID=2856 /ORGANISM="Cylindrotheca closterium" /LENGTH=375 /DNA_ID=CAMNT_0000557709 /DNA_START=135 /DNA_END=1261 /DNA_ORIENTATION=+ /assembly_acc=CAM_ASM_000147